MNGETFNVVRSVDGAGGWTDDGIVAPATCVVADGICSFQATKASYYAVYNEDEEEEEEEEEEASPQANNSGGGSSGGGVPCYCIPEINYENDEEIKVESVDAQETIIEEEVASKSEGNVFEKNNVALEPEISVTPTEANVEKQAVNTLEGVLRVSDNLNRGNLMLLFGNSVVYVKTSRDFRDLMGKNVVASVEGTLDNFILRGMEENDGDVDRSKNTENPVEVNQVAEFTKTKKDKPFIASFFASIGRMIFRSLSLF